MRKENEISHERSAMQIIGGNSLKGEVPVSGYKHALSLLIPASILASNQETTIHNFPNTFESDIQIKILQNLGSSVDVKDHAMKFNPASIMNRSVPKELSSQIHGSVYLIPALLGRFGEVHFGNAGGDQFVDPLKGKGERSINHVVSVLERFGARFTSSANGIRGTADKLRGQVIDVNEYAEHKETGSGGAISGVTKTALLAASVAEGTTIIKNPWNKEAAIELLSFLKKCGCNMEIQNDYWEIEGGLKSHPITHDLISDPTEIMTYIACSTLMKSPITITGLTGIKAQKALEPELQVMEKMGIGLEWQKDRLNVTPPSQLKAIDVVATSRGINTDSHPFFTLMLTSADSPSTVTDNVWKHRFAYTDHLNQLGADLKTGNQTVFISPQLPSRAGTTINSADTRAGAVAILGALAVKGMTTVKNLHHINRGYEKLDSKLRGLGAQIQVD